MENKFKFDLCIVKHCKKHAFDMMDKHIDCNNAEIADLGYVLSEDIDFIYQKYIDLYNEYVKLINK